MKKVFLFLIALVIVFVFESAQAQDQDDGYQLETLTVSSGSSPVTSGISGIARFRNSNGRFVEIAAQSEQAWFVYGQYFERGNFTLTVAATVGHLQGVLWAGPQMDVSIQLNKRVSLGALYWPGFFLEEPEDWKTENDGVENPESILQGQFGGVRLSIGPVQLSYYMLNFLDEPWNELPGTSFTWAVRDDLEVSMSLTRNNNDQDWLPWIGLIWSP